MITSFWIEEDKGLPPRSSEPFGLSLLPGPPVLLSLVDNQLPHDAARLRRDEQGHDGT